MRHPEGLIVIGPLAFGCRDRAFIEGCGVMREGRREVYWTQEHIDLTEVAAPGGSGRHTAVLLVDDFRERREVLTRLLKGEEQPHVKTERFVVPLGSTPSGQPSTTVAPAWASVSTALDIGPATSLETGLCSWSSITPTRKSSSRVWREGDKVQV